MRAVVLSAAVIALAFPAVSAQEARRAPSTEARTDAPRPSATDHESSPRWTDLAPGQGSLLSQLNAVIRARSAGVRAEAALPENIVHVTPGMSDEIVAAEENCRLMPSPGSRIFTERCFNETSAEKRLNEYQFDEELRFSRQEAARRQMEEAMRAQEAARRAAAGR